MTVAASATAEGRTFGHRSWRVATLRPFFQTSEHDLDPVAAFAVALVVPDGLAARLPARNAGPYPPPVLQGLPEPAHVTSPVGEQPV